MNLPNKLTCIRILLIPIFILFALNYSCIEGIGKWIALFIFCIASFTDFLDGQIARKYKLVTNFGKFIDQLADKLLICSSLICLLSIGKISPIVVIIIVMREFIISGFRLVASNSGIVIESNIFGKIKTVSQMIMIIIFLIVDNTCSMFCIIIEIIVVILTLISLIIYIYDNINIIFNRR